MSRISLQLNQNAVFLPDVYSIEKSEQAFGESFLRAGYTLSQYLEQIELAIVADQAFTDEPFNLVALGLFSKLRCHYYSSVLLEIHHDHVGSQFLTEQLWETAITMTYLIEEADEHFFSEYVATSARQAHHLLTDIEAKLQVFPGHPGLPVLRDKLKSCIAQQQRYFAGLSVTASPGVYAWGPQEADTTAKRGAITGLGTLTNPARTVLLHVTPASWLDLQLNYLNADRSCNKAESITNFRCLRDTAHLCLHVTRTFLEEVVNNCQNAEVLDIEGLYRDLGILFEWFHSAYDAYRMHFVVGELEWDSKPQVDWSWM